MKMFCLILTLLLFKNGSAQTIVTIAGNNTAGYTGDGSLAVKAQINFAANIAFDKRGNLYISDQDNDVIRKIDKSGIITTFAGTSSGGYTGDNGLAIHAELNGPIGLAFDHIGNLYISDFGNNVVRKIDTTGIITTFAGSGKAAFGGDGGPAINAGMTPYGIACDNSGNIFIADANNLRVRKVDKSGVITTIAGGGSDLGSGISATSAKLVYPGIIAIGPSNALYIPDWTHHRVCKVDASGILTTVAGNGLGGNNGDGGLAVNAELRAPNAVTFDNAGNMYISDNFANVVRKVNTAGIITTIAGDGTQGYSGDGGSPTNAKLNDPNDAMIGPDGNLYFADVNNNVIREVIYSTGVSQTNSLKYSVYPNPAKEQITIQTDQQIVSIEISNPIGQIVYNHPYSNTNNIMLSVEDWPAGVYFIRINNAWVQKLVKE